MAPMWLTVVAWAYLSLCFSCAGLIAYDVVVNHRRQSMSVMNFVFPISALYFGPFALAFYWRWGRASATRPAMTMGTSGVTNTAAHDHGMMAMPESSTKDMASGESRPWWVTMAIEVSHCGSGCTLGDVISEFAIFGLGLAVAGFTLGAEYAGDYILALALGIVFQYFAIAPMRGLGVKDGLVAAAKADFIALSAFELGLFGWMAIMTYVLFPAPHHLTPSSSAYWLLMQIGMIVGFGTSWPANVWLVKRGIKVPM